MSNAIHSAHMMGPIAYRMGMLVALRSMSLGGLHVGLMITASHNSEEDNGVKAIEPSGDMLDASWEVFADDIVNTPDDLLDQKIFELKTTIFGKQLRKDNVNAYKANVLLGRDTRASGKELTQLAIQGILKLGGSIQDFGIVTTPQLHFLVGELGPRFYKEILADAYYSKISQGFEKFISSICFSHTEQIASNVFVDTANGVGHLALKEVLNSIHNLPIKVNLLQCGNGVLNEKCGADYVKISNCPPAGVSFVDPSYRYVSFDGDADRVVYFYFDEKQQFQLIDGDRMAALFAFFISKHLKILGLQSSLSVGVIQTAYSNGACQKYLIEELETCLELTCTGVKHLHSAAKKYDSGIYFEANGHGTILFSGKFKKALAFLSSPEKMNALSSTERSSVGLLCGLVETINSYVGDAISDFLAVEGVLLSLGFSMKDWKSMYTEHPSKQAKISVPDRSIFKTTHYEQKLLEPAGIQEKIDGIVNPMHGGRAFVRPSGTENVVRIYAEASQAADVDIIIESIQNLLNCH
ncbi:hypothetical protein DI09_9p220 [Mitosporidium daphniae]|uniref:Phosphoacetylglucosamine mutase n=1 Tax=Mitosporidium daphniae TaxID=1485682 RepID=A0A098VMD6_9MICR|nr:uncharacterized protein DI09_9p220 [Mitosporidium daphniae]KGG49939.1 hypothetical protein DI09_9p220 [Mitosporidium daphniae]|eukprot:XP_013236366.1 uncharacterized protein DI09_9p220 [Mitosporidium daphniae]